ncbi:MAG TPA: signal peptidase II [Anaerolineales bacterium]
MNSPEKQTQRSHLLFAYLTLILIAGTVILLDQWTKDLVRANLAFGEQYMPWAWLAPYARILNWRNTGAAFGLFQEGGGIFTILAIAVAIMIIYYFPRIQRGDWSLRLAMGLQLGGAVGNLIDRLQHGYVTDFISISSFPVFNVADTSITLGVVILMLSIWLGGDRETTEPAPVKEHLASD